jgi:hypothetical protein
MYTRQCTYMFAAAHRTLHASQVHSTITNQKLIHSIWGALPDQIQANAQVTLHLYFSGSYPIHTNRLAIQ